MRKQTRARHRTLQYIAVVRAHAMAGGHSCCSLAWCSVQEGDHPQSWQGDLLMLQSCPVAVYKEESTHSRAKAAHLSARGRRRWRRRRSAATASG